MLHQALLLLSLQALCANVIAALASFVQAADIAAVNTKFFLICLCRTAEDIRQKGQPPRKLNKFLIKNPQEHKNVLYICSL